jgi:putative nucleotidyltransferase with HDIG domain
MPVNVMLAQEIVRLCNRKNLDKSRFLKLVSSDQGLAAQILRLANTSFYNYPRSIVSLDRAVVVMGFELVKEIALSLSVKSLFMNTTVDLREMANTFWNHSLNTAVILKVLAENYDSENQDLLYYGGLLHDCGKLVILQLLGREYRLLMEKSVQENRNLREVERTFLGYDHSEIGALLLEKWQLPRNMVLLARYHHKPVEYNSGEKLDFWIRLVYLGNLIAHFFEMGLLNYKDLRELDPEYEDFFSISEKDFRKLVQAVQIELKDHRDVIKFMETSQT